MHITGDAGILRGPVRPGKAMLGDASGGLSEEDKAAVRGLALEAIRDYGLQRQAGLSEILTARDIAHCFTGAPALMGLFFAETAPSNYREWINSNYEFYDTLAPELHNQGILVEPDSREPWFLCEAHTDNCLDDTLARFERAVDITIRKMSDAA